MKVSAIRQRIEKYVQQGGVHIAGEQTSSLTQGLNLLSGLILVGCAWSCIACCMSMYQCCVLMVNKISYAVFGYPLLGSLLMRLMVLVGKTTYAELGKEKEAKKKLADDQEIVDNKR